MASSYKIGTFVYGKADNAVYEVIGHHPSIEGLLIVEDHDCKPRYIKDTTVYAVE
jgi:hypothetical protein